MKNVEIKCRKCTPGHKKLLNLFKDLLDAILTDKTLESEFKKAKIKMKMKKQKIEKMKMKMKMMIMIMKMKMMMKQCIKTKNETIKGKNDILD